VYQARNGAGLNDVDGSNLVGTTFGPMPAINFTERGWFDGIGHDESVDASA
jgi:hypothetical protein